MKNAVALTLGLLALGAVPAAAADLGSRMPVKAPIMAPIAYNWTGGYVGVNAGYNWGKTSFTDRDGFNTLVGDNWTNNNSGFTGGMQAGYNWQYNMIVFGVEADLGYLNAKGSGTAPASCRFFACDTVGSTSSDFYATVRGRLGLAFDRFMVYGTGGGIGINTKTSVIDNCSVGLCGAATTNASDSSFRTGWTAGGGIEFAVSGPWTIKAEYLYYDLGSKTVSAPAFFPPAAAPGANFNWDTKTTGNIVRLGINYRFGPDAVIARY